MNEEKTLVAFFGVEGGGFDLFIYADGTCEEAGSSGGFLDEEEDPVIYWNEKYPNLKEWWSSFINKHMGYWHYFFVGNMHPDYKDVLREFALQTIEEMSDTEKEQFNMDSFSRHWQFA